MSHKLHRWIVLVLTISLLAAACGSDDTTDTTPVTSPPTTQPNTSTTPPTTTPTECIDIDDTSAPAGLPAPVAETYTAILEALTKCDFEALGELASSGERDFTYSFGGSDDPAGFWAGQTADSETIALLAEIMVKSFGSMETQFTADESTEIYYWPAVFGPNPTDAQWDEVRDLYSDEEIEQMKSFGGYIGHRSGIVADGEWVFFVAGD